MSPRTVNVQPMLLRPGATLVASGRWSLIFFAGDLGPAAKAIINAGRVVINIAPDGSLTLVSQRGHEEDICALLS